MDQQSTRARGDSTGNCHGIYLYRQVCAARRESMRLCVSSMQRCASTMARGCHGQVYRSLLNRPFEYTAKITSEEKRRRLVERFACQPACDAESFPCLYSSPQNRHCFCYKNNTREVQADFLSSLIIPSPFA